VQFECSDSTTQSLTKEGNNESGRGGWRPAWGIVLKKSIALLLAAAIFSALLASAPGGNRRATNARGEERKAIALELESRGRPT
jgi:hypothetical protein